MAAALPAITIRQPWAQAIAIGHKTVENRGRPTWYRGPIAIHAAATTDTRADRDPRIINAYGRDASISLARGAVIAVARLIDCHEAEQPIPPDATCCWPWGDRVYNDRPAWHLVLADPVMLDLPVPAKGKLTIPWALPADAAEWAIVQVATVAEHHRMPTYQASARRICDAIHATEGASA